MAIQAQEAGALKALFEGGSAPNAPARNALSQFIQFQLGKALRTDQFEKSLRGGL